MLSLSHWSPAYEFGYGVQGDAYTGSAQYAHNENRNGYATGGEYRVALPDGRTQIVTYRVDNADSGYVADVRYEGVAIPYEAPSQHMHQLQLMLQLPNYLMLTYNYLFV